MEPQPTTGGPIFSNSDIYRSIAIEALASCEEALALFRKPAEGGGHCIEWDPTRRSFKQAFVAVVFAGMRMESHLWLFGCGVLGKARYAKVDPKKLELRLAPLGIHDDALKKALQTYRETRARIVHEKAVPFYEDTSPLSTAQDEASVAVRTMLQLDEAIGRRWKELAPKK